MIPMGGGAVALAILIRSFSPAHADVLAGDTATWMNESGVQHTVSAVDGTFGSARISGGGMFSHRFDAPGVVPYYCQVHPGMTGEVDVHRVLLDAPRDPGVPGVPYLLTGRAALPAGSAVALEADTGQGFLPAGAATVDDAGGFRAPLPLPSSAQVRAVAAGETSPPVRVEIVDRSVAAAAVTRGARVRVTVGVSPAAPGATVVLQLRLRERFGWWPQYTAHLGRDSRATFRFTLRRRVRARVALTLRDGATVLALSPTVRVGRSG